MERADGGQDDAGVDAVAVDMDRDAVPGGGRGRPVRGDQRSGEDSKGEEQRRREQGRRDGRNPAAGYLWTRQMTPPTSSLTNRSPFGPT